MDFLRKSPGKEILLELEKEKGNERKHLAGRYASGFSCMYFNHKISGYHVALIQVAGQCYQWHLDQTSA